MGQFFGPVASSRLGLSLGVDPFRGKVCDLDCVFCQLGATRRGDRPCGAPVDAAEILREARRVAATAAAREADVVTLGGSGEPTLHPEFGRLVEALRDLFARPVAVLTNGVSAWRSRVRRALLRADRVLPTVAAPDPTTFQLLHRPLSPRAFERHRQGLLRLRDDYSGRLSAEVMLVRGLNDRDEDLERLAGFLERLAPDDVDITLPDRPPAESWVERPPFARVLRAARRLGARLPAPSPSPRRVRLDAQALAALARRHPLRLDEALGLLGGGGQARRDVARLLRSRRVGLRRKGRERFLVPR